MIPNDQDAQKDQQPTAYSPPLLRSKAHGGITSNEHLKGSPSDTDDVVQDNERQFLAVLKAEKDKELLEPVIYTVLKNVSIKNCRMPGEVDSNSFQDWKVKILGKLTEISVRMRAKSKYSIEGQLIWMILLQDVICGSRCPKR